MPMPASRSTSAGTGRETLNRDDPSAMRMPISRVRFAVEKQAFHKGRRPQGLSPVDRTRWRPAVRSCSPSLMELLLCYSYFVLWKKGVRASQAKTLHGLRSLARDCDSPLPHRRPSPKIGSPRWLLWLEDTSTDESRRAAAALRSSTAMLTN